MFFQLTEEDIFKICSQCDKHKDGYCEKEAKPVQELRRCKEWNKFYNQKCIRKR